jgi:hypothetical protein
MIIVLEPCHEVMNHCDLSCQFYPSALCIFYILFIFFIFSCYNGESYLWKMVCIRTSDFDLDVPEGFGARRGAAPTRPRGATPEAPPPPPSPPPPVSIEQLLATQNELMRVLT